MHVSVHVSVLLYACAYVCVCDIAFCLRPGDTYICMRVCI